MKLLLLVGSGSFIGGMLRYLVSRSIQYKILSFPTGTLTVNIIGCFLIGIIFGIVMKGNMSTEWQLFLATGILGGFTTYSAFSIEAIGLMRSGNLVYALIYILTTVILGLLATYAGFSAAKSA